LPPTGTGTKIAKRPASRGNPALARRVAITGAAGQLGSELVRAFGVAGDDVLALARPEFDITEPAHLERLTSWRPDIVVNAAAWTDVDGCAREPQRAMAINGDGAGAVARAAADAGAMIVQVSSNEVFDGTLDRPYVETDEPNPINPYGASKLAGERLVAAANPRHLIVRTAWLYGGAVSFPEKIRAAAERALAEGTELRVVDDEWGNPTDVRWLGPAIERLVRIELADPEPLHAYHLAGWPPTTRYEWARRLLAALPVRLRPISADEYPRASRVPRRAVLDLARAAARGISPAAWESPARG
jgi:dTDP-4-dehydrorhamnose reductase